MSPEIVVSDFHDYTTDIWTLGILLHELSYGLTPFYSKEIKNI